MKNNIIRNNNLDLLRNISCIFVVIIHVSAIWIDFINNGIIDNNLFFTIINTISKFAVPIFFMISGFLNISNDKNENYKYFFSKTLKRLIIPCILFSSFYAIIKLCESFFKNIETMIIIKEIIAGNLGALWFLYAIIPIYLITPLLILIKKNVGNKFFIKLSIIYFVYAIISSIFSRYNASWTLGNAADYLGFYLFGFVLGNSKYRLNSLKFFAIILSIICLSSLNCFLVFNYNNTNLCFDFSNNFNPINVLNSILIFLLLFKANINFSSYKFAKYTFAIYLIHPFFISIFTRLIGKDLLLNRPYFYFIAMFLIVMILSILFSIVYNYFYDKFLLLLEKK